MARRKFDVKPTDPPSLGLERPTSLPSPIRYPSPFQIWVDVLEILATLDVFEILHVRSFRIVFEYDGNSPPIR